MATKPKETSRRVALVPALLVAVAVVVALTTVVSQAARAVAPDGGDAIKLNQIQSIGSHNSYHLRASQSEFDVRQGVAPVYNIGLDYEHPSLGVQFSSQRIRQIELDVAADPDGGRYSTPLIRDVAGEGPLSPDDLAIMNQPGPKVFHVADVDYRSNCLSLVLCLEAVKTWSDANPSHAPIAILLEFKDDPTPVVPSPPAVTPILWDTSTMPAVDAAITSVFPPSQIVTPDDVRGSEPTVEAGALAGNWPTLGESRGKVIFLMDNGGSYRTDYLTLHPGLVGAPIFTNSRPGQSDAAFVKMNDPTGANTEVIQQLVRDGYVVRTRADADTLEARTNNTVPREAAFVSGAQWISTDYAGRGSADYLNSPYFVELPSGTTARCNPVNAPPGCVDASLDMPHVTPPPTDDVATTTASPPASSAPTLNPSSGPTSLPPSATAGQDQALGTRAAEPVNAQPRYAG